MAEMTMSFADLELALPHPHLNRYTAFKTSNASLLAYQLVEKRHPDTDFRISELVLHTQLSFNDLSPGSDIPLSNNSLWARAQRSPITEVLWDGEAPRIGQLWLVIYAFFTVHHGLEQFRLKLASQHAGVVKEELTAVGLAIEHPIRHDTFDEPTKYGRESEVVVLRSTFWQGAGSPFGPRPAWLGEPLAYAAADMRQAVSQHPILPLSYTMTTKFPELPVHVRHPVRPAKPQPGSVIYSRWIAHLREHFSMVALDYTNDAHLNLFHVWQNDPRVAAGWNETGTREEHREYLRKLHEDPHTITVLARFDDKFFAYYEIYWAKEDHLGAHYHAGDFDRGRHSLVGDESFRGHHRTSAWWACIMHYIFLDEPRTMDVVGEPRATSDVVLGYDFEAGMHIERFVDLGHKRSALVKLGRERFFQICPLGPPPEDVTERRLRGPRL